MTVSSFATLPGSAEEIHASLDRLLNSDKFRKTPSLRHLLEYLVSKAIEGHTDQIKESIIAIDVFGRREDFDGRLDNIVRVQAHRLRKLLDTYYLEEGKDEKVRFSVPKGSYIPQIECVGVEVEHTAAPAPEPAAVPVYTPRAEPVRIGGFVYAFVAGVLCSAAIFSVWLLANRGNGADPVDPAVAEIWSSVLAPGAKTIASYTNPSFLRVGTSRFFFNYSGPISAPAGAEVHLADDDPALDRQLLPKGQPLFFADGWTGTGEVLAVNRLTLLSSQFRSTLNVIPSRYLGVSDMHASNVIFLGAPWGNGVLAKLGSNSTPLYSQDKGHIMVRNPQGGEPPSFENVRDDSTHQLKTSYTLFSVLPGMDSAHTVLSSAGLGTTATWAGYRLHNNRNRRRATGEGLKSSEWRRLSALLPGCDPSGHHQRQPIQSEDCSGACISSFRVGA